MTTAEHVSGNGAGGLPRPEVVLHGAEEKPRGWLSWLTTTDHKRIGILYLVATFVFFLLGGVEALIAYFEETRSLQGGEG